VKRPEVDPNLLMLVLAAKLDPSWGVTALFLYLGGKNFR
jgi:hypothetical protein